jgi:hypothetical protein
MQAGASSPPPGLMVHPRHLTVITIMLGIALSVLDTTTIALGL